LAGCGRHDLQSVCDALNGKLARDTPQRLATGPVATMRLQIYISPHQPLGIQSYEMAAIGLHSSSIVRRWQGMFIGIEGGDDQP